MSKYTFTFKKDDIFVEFFTTDKGVVEKQFQLWVADADEYSRSHVKTVEVKESAAKVQPQKLEEKKVEEPKKVEKINEEPRLKTEAAPIGKPDAEVVNDSVVDKASTLLKTINTIQNPPVEEEKPTVNFEDVLGKSIENPTFEPSRIKDQVFLNLVNSKNTSDRFNYLLITAYYLSEFEKMERFSLKQINAKLMHNLSEVIDHMTLQEAINKRMVELVPDLTGLSDVAEYRLTREGEEFFANKI